MAELALAIAKLEESLQNRDLTSCVGEEDYLRKACGQYGSALLDLSKARNDLKPRRKRS